MPERRTRVGEAITVFDSAIQDLAIALAALERIGELSLATIDL